ncbi:MAG: hypothetical protein KA978_19540, partial [Deltaproteobacteria bacterium]|nr:hypothetical protein [Deltaproteobacteria bacterium]
MVLERGEGEGVVPECVDNDGDGFGFGNSCRPDCNDNDRTVTDQCYRCRPDDVRAGCACRPGTAPLPCDVTTDSNRGAENICLLGQRDCVNGVWSTCQQWRPAFPGASRYIGPVSECPGSCLPGCHHQVICHEGADAIPAGSSGVGTGSSTHAVFCPPEARTPGTRGGITGACTSGTGNAYNRAVSPQPWVDACAEPGSIRLLANSDDGTVTDTLPFTFNYYGVPQTSVGISANGMLGFPTASMLWTSQPLPYASIQNSIFAFWDDIETRGGGICVALVGTAPNRRYIVQWDDARLTSDTNAHLTFQVQLNETINAIDVLYRQMSGAGDAPSGSQATIGIQRDMGSSYDQVAYRTVGAVTAGSSIRWIPAMGSTVCARGTYNRVYNGACPPDAFGQPQVPYWGQFNYTSVVPQGTSLNFEVRLADSPTDLVTATPIRLPPAPLGAPSLPTSVDLGANIRSQQPLMTGLPMARYLELRAYLNPSPDGSLSPTLISTEVQFTCGPIDPDRACREGSDCFPGNPCLTGLVQCRNDSGGRPVEVCVAGPPQPAGHSCGLGFVCDGAGTCIECADGASCDLGRPCVRGRIGCSTGAPVCEVATQDPPGTACGMTSTVDDYRRSATPLAWIDVCAIPGHSTFLANQDDDIATETLPFGFSYYGQSFGAVGLSSNGMLSFPTASAQYINSSLPNTSIPNTIFSFWDDLYLRSNGICTTVLGSSPNRQYIAQWSNATFPGSTDLTTSLNFEVFLSEGTNAIDVLFGTMTGDGTLSSGSSATIGIQRDTGSITDQVSHDAVVTGLANSGYRWSPRVDNVCSPMGTCVACAPGSTCTLSDPCAIGTQTCATGTATCIRAGTRAPGTTCGTDLVCNRLGACITCRAGMACTPPGQPCQSGRISCSTGEPVCEPQGMVAPGTTCGTDLVCNRLGACIPCRTGEVCSGSGQCLTASIVCSSGEPVCTDMGIRPPNTNCTVSGNPGYCDRVGTCVPCVTNETCDGLDNNCNGLIDDAIADQTCGLGLCARTVPGCVSGMVPVCTPGMAIPEVCDNSDNNCNGLVDEGVNRSCYTGPSGTAGVGVCSPGTQTCSTGAWGSCVGEVTPSVEVCNGNDDDCDGVTDDGVVESCYTGPTGTAGVGVCRTGSRSCGGGAFGTCTGQVLPSTEVCNGRDDDCDGQVDEGLGTITCGIGACQRTTPACIGGVSQVCTPGGGVAEVCNNLDDDCDGSIDEGVTQSCYTGPSNTAGQGICRAGTQTCTTGSWNSCTGQVLPGTELCNNLDDDCNGTTDDPFTPGPLASSSTPRVLIYGPAGSLEVPYLPAGSVVTVASDSAWRSMTRQQFAQYNLIIIGDKDCSGPLTSDYQAAYDTRSVWNPAINGRVVVGTLAPACHASTYAAAGQFLRAALLWSANGGGTGLYVAGEWGRR